MADAPASPKRKIPGSSWLRGGTLRLRMPDAGDGERIIQSPVRWSETTKLLIGFAALLIGMVMLQRLTALILPLLLAFILVLLFDPAARWTLRKTGWRWPVSVIVVFLVTAVVLGILLYFFGTRLWEEILAVGDQVQAFVASNAALNGSSGSASGALGANIVSTSFRAIAQLAATTISLLGTLFFAAGVAFFVILDRAPSQAAAGSDDAQAVEAGIRADLNFLTDRTRALWGFWIYGQAILAAGTFASYWLLLTLLGVQNTLALSVVSMIGRFIPYLGATVTWILVFITALTQGTTRFGLEPLPYAVLVVALAIIVDQAFDQFVTPKVYGEIYQLPAWVVLVGTFGAGILLGFFGMLVAAPLMATSVLVGRYLLDHLIETSAVGSEDLPTVPPT